MENFTPIALALLDKFTSQRPGLDFANYGDVSAYRQEVRGITKDLHQYRALRQAVAYRTFSIKQWQDAFRAFSGRLSLIKKDGAYRLEYTTGQYFPTEYRCAACAVLASLLWDDRRESMPAEKYLVGGKHKAATYEAAQEVAKAKLPVIVSIEAVVDGVSPGEYLRRSFKREFGRAIASRWFN
jgi:hypothetical protein